MLADGGEGVRWRLYLFVFVVKRRNEIQVRMWSVIGGVRRRRRGGGGKEEGEEHGMT